MWYKSIAKCFYYWVFIQRPEEEEDDLNSADDRKPSEESHGASDEAQLGLRFDLLVSLNVVKGCRVKVDAD